MQSFWETKPCRWVRKAITLCSQHARLLLHDFLCCAFSYGIKRSPVSDMWFSSFYSHDFQVILLLFHQHCTSAVRWISHITGVWSLAVSCVLATFWIAMIPDNSNLRGGRFLWGHSCQGLWWETWGGCSHCTHNQEAETERGLCLDYFLLFSQFRTPVHGMVPRIRLDLSTSTNLIQIILCRHAQVQYIFPWFL